MILIAIQISTLSLNPKTLNPKPLTLNPKASVFTCPVGCFKGFVFAPILARLCPTANAIPKRVLMGTPNREPQEYSSHIIEYNILLYSWGSLFGVPIIVPVVWGSWGWGVASDFWGLALRSFEARDLAGLPEPQKYLE